MQMREAGAFFFALCTTCLSVRGDCARGIERGLIRYLQVPHGHLLCAALCSTYLWLCIVKWIILKKGKDRHISILVADTSGSQSSHRLVDGVKAGEDTVLAD
jgi:hypothetical protein